MTTLLLVEDSQDDVFIVQRACARSGFPLSLQTVSDGQMAIEYLGGEGVYQDRTVYPMPHLVFLDINMPRRNGHDVLTWIRAQPGLRRLPVVMLTGSVLDTDVARAYHLGVTSYIQKNADLAEFGQAVRVVLKYWLGMNVLSA